jgi:SAM-dependent methyltransferase
MPREQDVAATHAFGRKVDFGKTASDYRCFRAGFPPTFFEALANRGWLGSGRRALDLGTGTGTVARGLAKRGFSVIGVDPAVELLVAARMTDDQAGVSITYRQGRAEALEEATSSVDLVTAGQCWHWFDRPKAASEVSRVLVPGGRIIIAHFDWLPLPGNVVEATEELILALNPQWTMGGGTGIYPQWLRDLAVEGFEDLETFSFDVAQSYSHKAWCGRIRASAGVKASLDTEMIKHFDTALAEILKTRFPQDPLYIPHRVWAASGVKH